VSINLAELSSLDRQGDLPFSAVMRFAAQTIVSQALQSPIR
jgi:hypothetical protein